MVKQTSELTEEAGRFTMDLYVGITELRKKAYGGTQSRSSWFTRNKEDKQYEKNHPPPVGRDA